MDNLIKKETFWIYPEVQYPTNRSSAKTKQRKQRRGNCHETKRISFSRAEDNLLLSTTERA